MSPNGRVAAGCDQRERVAKQSREPQLEQVAGLPGRNETLAQRLEREQRLDHIEGDD
jgi:hypothetical protein